MVGSASVAPLDPDYKQALTQTLAPPHTKNDHVDISLVSRTLPDLFGIARPKQFKLLKLLPAIRRCRYLIFRGIV
jgi:hypothetical protein